MQALCLTIARGCLFAWIGAASLFVVTSIAEQRDPAFDSPTRNALAALRFPYYYQFEFALVGAGFAAALAAWKHPALGPKRMRTFLTLMLAAAAVIAWDYIAVFRPLLEMMSLDTKPADFQHLHEMSKWLNFTVLVLVLASAVIISWSRADRASAR